MVLGNIPGLPEALQNSGEAKRVRAEIAAQNGAKDQAAEGASELQTSPGAAEAFLANFGGRDAHLATIKGKSAPVGHRGDDALATVQKLNADGANVYFHVNRAKSGVTKKAAKSDIEAIRAIPCDVDPPKGMEWGAAQAALAERRKELEGCVLPPTAILNSGGGLQAFWILSAEPAATTETVARVEAIGAAIATRFGGDNVRNIDRIMRVPGFVNWPSAGKAARGQVPAVAKVIGGTRRAYTLGEMEAAFPPTVAKNGHAMPGDARAGDPGGNDELAGGIGDAYDIAEVREVLMWLAAHPSKPLELGIYNAGEINWRDSVEFALAEISVRQPELSAEAHALVIELAAAVGRNPDDCSERFERDLPRTAKLIAEGKATKSIRSVFKAALEMGWQSGAGATQAGSAGTSAGPEAECSDGSRADAGGTPGASGFATSADTGPVDIFDPPVAVPFPLHVLPPVLRAFVARSGEALGADTSALAISALTAVAGAIDARTMLRLSKGSWIVRPILRTLLIGDPSTMKTPIIQATTEPLVVLDGRLQAQFRQALNAYKGQKLGRVQPLPPPPERPAQFIINEATPQKACEILSRKPRGSFLVRDEMSGLFSSFAHATDDRSFWLQSFDGGSHRKQKVGNGRDDVESDIWVENNALSMLGAIQPERLSAFVDLTADGLMQRFIPLKVMAGRKPDLDADTAAETGRYRRLLEVIAGRGDYGTLELSDEAKKVRDEVIDHLVKLENSVAVARNTSTFSTAVGKLRGLWARFVLILHIAEHEGSQLAAEVGTPSPSIACEVSKETAQRAAELLDWAKQTLFLFYFGAGQFTDEAKSVASAILTSGMLSITARDAMRKVNSLKGFSTKQVADVMSILEAAGWLIPSPTKGLNVVREWMVDPEVHTKFRQLAAEETARKASLRALMRESFASRRKSQP